jgi:hypothetical protein
MNLLKVVDGTMLGDAWISPESYYGFAQSKVHAE